MLAVLLWMAACTPSESVFEVVSSEQLLTLDEDDYAPGRVLLAASGETPVVFGEALALERELLALGVEAWSLPADVDAVEATLALRAQGRFDFVEPDLARDGLEWTPDDPQYEHQWHFELIGMPSAWTRATGAGVRVAVVDSGVSRAGLDTPGLLLGWDFVADDADPSDEHRHGTHVAGTIAQATDNGVRGAGIAPDASIVPVRVLNASNRGSVLKMAAGIEWAADAGAQIINLSLGGTTDSATERAAVEYAAASGALLVAAAGNNGDDNVLYPAAYEAVMAVAAVGPDDERASYSSWGDTIEISAPGGVSGSSVWQETFSSDGSDPNDYMLRGMRGTSMAAPHVAGVAALLMEHGLDAEETREALVASAVDLDAAGWDAYTGHGRVDAAAALDWALGTASEAPQICGVSGTVVDGWGRQVSGQVAGAATIEVCFTGADCVEMQADGSFSTEVIWSPYSDSYTLEVADPSGMRASYGPWGFDTDASDPCVGG